MILRAHDALADALRILLKARDPLSRMLRAERERQRDIETEKYRESNRGKELLWSKRKIDRYTI